MTSAARLLGKWRCYSSERKASGASIREQPPTGGPAPSRDQHFQARTRANCLFGIKGLSMVGAPGGCGRAPPRSASAPAIDMKCRRRRGWSISRTCAVRGGPRDRCGMRARAARRDWPSAWACARGWTALRAGPMLVRASSWSRWRACGTSVGRVRPIIHGAQQR